MSFSIQREPYVRLSLPAGQTLTSTVWADLSMTNEISDDFGIHSANGIITIPRPGVYLVSLSVNFTNNGTNIIRIVRNSTEIVQQPCPYTAASCSFLTACNAGDTFQAGAITFTAGVNVAASNDNTFTGVRLCL